MSFIRMASVGLAVAVLASFSGCGEDAGSGGAAPIDENRPDAGLEAAKKIQQMQPPPPPGKKARH
ncbi:MAG: hypothetical protein BGO49_28055 [Planctomycetales bacterium 71-10]|nr:MAG: hypothetical protein BGO49_28055 [Planctomycetales bacterium 71-10]